MTRNLAMVVSSALMIGMSPCNASSTSSLSPEALSFEKTCIEANSNCLYENARFDSSRRLFVERHFYRLLRNRDDVKSYNQLVEAGLIRNAASGLGVKQLLVKRYDRNAEKWMSFPGTKKCKYCVDSSYFRGNHAKLYRIDLLQQINAGSNDLIALGTVVYKNQDIIERFIISAPGLFHPKDTSRIYIESRIKGHHTLRSINRGGVILNLDGGGVPGPMPDYVSFSPLKSWAIVAKQYRNREMELVANIGDLPSHPKGTLADRLKWVAQELASYKIHYDRVAIGAFPSLTPNEVIANRHGDCKALTTLAAALLMRSGVRTHTIVLSAYSQPPVSFVVPSHFWGMLHVLLYLPDMNIYIDPSRIASFGAKWKTSANKYQGAVGLDNATGKFVVVH